MSPAEIAEILNDFVRKMVLNPKAVQITTTVRSSFALFTIKTDQADARRVIGSGGRHFMALETIAGALARRISMEARLVLDEQFQPFALPTVKAAWLATSNAEAPCNLKELLTRTLMPFVEDVDAFEVIDTDLGKTTLVEINVTAADYPAIYGAEVMFGYGLDGRLIGSIKNLVDGIGKNHGKLVHVVISHK